MLSSTAGLPFDRTAVYTGMVDGSTVANIADADGHSIRRGLHDQIAQFGGAVRLGSDQSQDQLMVRLVEAGRVDDVRFLDGIDQLEQGYPGGLKPGEIGHDVELGNLAALHQHRADPIDPVEGRL